MTDIKETMPIKNKRREFMKSKLKHAMASFQEFSNKCAGSKESQNIHKQKRGDDPECFRINLTNLSPSAKKNQGNEKTFNFLKETQKVSKLDLTRF